MTPKEQRAKLLTEIMEADQKIGLYENQTAVEWLYSHLFPKQLDGFSDEEWGKIDKAFDQAKQMEKEQLLNAYDNVFLDDNGNFLNGEQYYNETYGTK